MPPTAEFMAQNKMLVCAYDTSVEKMPDGSFDTVQIPLRSYALPAQLINCSASHFFLITKQKPAYCKYENREKPAFLQVV